MKYWILLVIIVFVLCYVVANRNSIITENLETAPELTEDQTKQCNNLKDARDSDNAMKKMLYKALKSEGRIPKFCEAILNPMPVPADAAAAPGGASGDSGGGSGESGSGGEVAALASKLTALQQEVSNMKAKAKDQASQAAAAQASLQAID
jgi:hypothetical protein